MKIEFDQETALDCRGWISNKELGVIVIDFLTFKSFVSIPALMIFYYLGAVVLPLAAWLFSLWLAHKFQLFGEARKRWRTQLWEVLSPKQRMLLLFAFLMMFLLMELFWRMLFEYLIAFMQMRDALELYIQSEGVRGV